MIDNILGIWRTVVEWVTSHADNTYRIMPNAVR